MQAQLRERLNTERKSAAENSRILQALDHVSASVIMADGEGKIIYLNNAAKTLFHNAQADIRKDISAFDAQRLPGNSIDIFYKNLGHQAQQTDHQHTEIELGGRTFRFVANLVVHDSGKRLGTVMEWAERTAELAVEIRDGPEVHAGVAIAHSGRN